MLLWLALAGLSDAGTDAARRAASHEVARRLGVGWRPEVPAVPVQVPPSLVQLRDALTKVWATDQIHWKKRDFLQAAVASRSRLMQLADLSDSMVYPARYVDPWASWGVSVFDPRHTSTTVPMPVFPEEARGVSGEGPFVARADPRMDAVYRAMLGEFFDVPDATFPFFSRFIQQLPDLWDWAITQPPEVLVRMSWAEMRTASDAWHLSLRGKRGQDVQYRGPVPDAWVVAAWPDGWTVQRLLTRRDFAREGIAMGHCVGGDAQGDALPDGDSRYWRDTRDGRSMILSLRDPTNIPQITVEVDLRPSTPKAVQVQGPDDRAPLPEAAARLGPMLDAFSIAPLDATKRRFDHAAADSCERLSASADARAELKAAIDDRLRISKPTGEAVFRLALTEAIGWMDAYDSGAVSFMDAIEVETELTEENPVVYAALVSFDSVPVRAALVRPSGTSRWIVYPVPMSRLEAVQADEDLSIFEALAETPRSALTASAPLSLVDAVHRVLQNPDPHEVGLPTLRVPTMQARAPRPSLPKSLVESS